MKSFVLASFAVAGAYAIVLPRQGCSNSCKGFTITAQGKVVSGTIGQLDDGQNRILGGLAPATYTICNGGLVDSNGRGCIITPPTSQWQCDTGATPTGGFSIGNTGLLLSVGNPTFWACPTGPTDQDEWNIYQNALAGEPRCIQVTLQTSCQAAPPSTPPPSTPPPSNPPPQTNGACPADLNGAYEFPHLIVPIDSSKPDHAHGTQYFATATPQISTIFNFDILQSDAGKTCTLIFLLPLKADLQTSSFTLTGNWVDFSQLSAIAGSGTTYNNRPSKSADLGNVNLVPGSTAVVLKTWTCQAGQVAFEMDSMQGTQFNYFQDWNPKPIGLWIRKC